MAWWVQACRLLQPAQRRDSQWRRRACETCYHRVVSAEVDPDRAHDWSVRHCPVCDLYKGRQTSQTSLRNLSLKQQLNMGRTWAFYLRLGTLRYFKCPGCQTRWKTLEFLPAGELWRRLPWPQHCECGGRRLIQTELCLDKKQKRLILSILRRNGAMPIYTYRIKPKGVPAYEIEVFESAQTTAATSVAGIDPETILAGDLSGLEPDTPVERIPSAPGGFQGLPTPKFHG